VPDVPATYDVGDSIKLTFTVRDEADALINATIAIVVTKPDGTPVSPAPTITPVSTGIYTAILAVDVAGLWVYRWAATGAATTSEDGQFYVQAAATTNVYTTLPELKDALNIPQADTSLDDIFQAAILAVSREIDQHCGRHFFKLTEARTFTPTHRHLLKLGEFNDLASVTTLKTDSSGDGTFETTWTTGDYQLLTAAGTSNVNAAPEPKPYTQVRAVAGQTFPCAWAWNTRADRVEITGTWGWPQVPVAVREACKLLSVESGKLLREAPFGVAGFGEFGVVRVRDNRKAMQYLAPYRRGMAAVPIA
jgi:hypothetical protein